MGTFIHSYIVVKIFCSNTFRRDNYFSSAKIRVYLLCHMTEHVVLITF